MFNKKEIIDMSNIIRHVKKSISDEEVLFEGFKNTIYGSLICSVNALNEPHLEDSEILKRAKKAHLPFVDDPDFIKKTVEAFGFDYEKNVVGKPLATFSTPHNTLIAPYVWVTNEDGDMEIKALSYERDGFRQRTLLNGEARVIDWEEE